MRYTVTVVINQAYESQADGSRHLLRLMPIDLVDEQRVLSARLQVTPHDVTVSNRTDFFGNKASEVTFGSAHAEVEFRVDAQVERLSGPSGLDISPKLKRLSEEVADVQSLDREAPHHFLGASPRVRPSAAMTAYAAEHVEPECTTIEAVTAIGTALNRDFRYDPEATDVDTPPEEAFAARHGVCQDFAHVMIACLRGIGVPAGYVSGFLRTIPPPGQKRLEGADAMHAWVRAWCGFEAGWIEYDPTNALVVGSDHIVVARGRDYADVAPVKGVLRTSGAQKTHQAVDVVPMEAKRTGALAAGKAP